MRAQRLLLLMLTWLGIAGCGSSEESEQNADGRSTAPPVLMADEDPDREPSVDELMAKLGVGNRGGAQKVGGKIRIVDLAGSNVKDLSPLAGLDLKQLDLRQTRVIDLSPLQGMSLDELYLEETPVTDLTPLAGMPLKKLYLSSTPVTSIAALRGMTLSELNLNGSKLESLAGIETMRVEILWLPRTPITDLSPLTGVQLVSLDLEETAVVSLEPLREMTSLRRLNLANCGVTDLTPLKDLKLSRLVVTPSKITQGLDGLRQMSSLEQIGVTLETVLPAAEFWKLLDAGQL